MRRLRRLLKPVNWAYALGELVLIVAGVLIALSANAWWEDRRERREELRLLRQMVTELRRDSAYAEGAIGRLHQRRASALIVARHLDGGLPYADSLAVHLGRVGIVTTREYSTGVYETLKSRGLDRVSNDSLRMAITDLYEAHYREAGNLERAYEKISLDHWFPVLMRRFRYADERHGAGHPRDYAALARDEDFRVVLDGYLVQFTDLLPSAEATAGRINALLMAIDRELARRE